MIPLSEWMRSCPLPDQPWLILGKGPSFARRHHLDLSGYNLVSLNHVVRELKVDVAHYIDLDAVEQCADVLPRNADWLLLPRYPHVNFRPSDEQPPEHPELIRVLWRMQEPRKIVMAALYRHVAGTELRVYLGPESANDFLHSQVERLDVNVLEERATVLRYVLLENGWRDATP